jgi:hypothetical protein
MMSATGTMKLRNLSDLFLYELWTLCDAKKQVMPVLLRMSRLASKRELREELRQMLTMPGNTCTLSEPSFPAMKRSRQ